jgi:hypothetical protein
MRELIVHDDRELRRVERTIATIEQAPDAGKLSRHCLLAALHAERVELLRALGRGRAARPSANAAGAWH